jgi:hypothetical protein
MQPIIIQEVGEKFTGKCLGVGDGDNKRRAVHIVHMGHCSLVDKTPAGVINIRL